MNRPTAVVLAVVVTTATLSAAVVGAGASAASPSQHAVAATDAGTQSDAYAGTYVTFETNDTALTEYRVGGDPVFENVSVAGQSEAGVGGSLGLSAVANLSGVGLELGAASNTRAEVSTDGSASLTAHDTERGILTVDAGEESQYVELELASGTNATDERDDRVVVESDDRTGALLVVGDGEVTVNERGNVTADLESDSTLVYRSYESGERDDDAEEQERLIAEGTATAEIYADARDGERAIDVATYGQDLAVEGAADAEDRIEMAVERAHGEGTIVIASVSEAALAAGESVENLSVTVDGEAAAEASSYGELEGGIGNEPRYMVAHSSDASAAADVLVAVDHFSERNVVIQNDDDSDGNDGGDDSPSDGEDEIISDDGDDSNDDGTTDTVPGFGVAAALIGLLLSVAVRGRNYGNN